MRHKKDLKSLIYNKLSPKVIDTVKLAIHCPILMDKQGNKIRPYNAMLFDILLKNVTQNKSGFVLNSTQGIYTRTKDSLFLGKSTIYDNFERLILDGKVQCPSHNYNMHFRVYEERVDLEFSIPKFIYGTNVVQSLQHYKRLHTPYEILVKSLKKIFEETFFGVPVNWGAVELIRWDMCFNQIFKTREESLKALKYIKLKHQSKGDKLNYEYGLIELTKSNYLKIYHKGEEFEKHDMSKYQGLFLDEFRDISQRVLRYEKKFTRANISYTYNTQFKTINHSDYEEYKRQKKLGKISRYLRNEFESVQRFTLANSKIQDCTKLPPALFNYTHAKFKEEIRKKFTIGKKSIDHLTNVVIDAPKDSGVKIKVLSYIKTFGSLKRAYEMGAFSRATYARYKNILEAKNLSETKVPVQILQDWTDSSYHRLLFSKGVSISMITKNIDF